MAKKFTFVVITDKASKVKKIRISVNIMVIGTVFAVCFLAFSGNLFQQYFTDSLNNPTIDKLMEEVSTRDQQSRIYEKNITSISMVFDKLNESKRKLRNLTNANIEEDASNAKKLQSSLLRKYNTLDDKSVLNLINDPQQQDKTDSRIEEKFVEKMISYQRSQPWLYSDFAIGLEPKGFQISGFGYGNNSGTVIGEHLKGIIISGVENSSVLSPSSGFVLKTGSNDALGRYAVIAHNKYFVTTIGLLNSIKLNPGDTVLAGDIVGKISNSGIYDIPHYYIQIDFLNVPQNPAPILFSVK